MTKTKIKDLITKIHFYLVGFTLMNFALKKTIEISLNYRLAYCIILLIYVSGIILFLLNYNPFKKIVFYFSIYVITPFLTILFWMFGGVFLALLNSIFLYPIYPNIIKLEFDEIVIYSKYQGFMGSCCTYEVTEKRYFLLEKKINEINCDEDFDFENVTIESIYKGSE